MLRQTLAKQGRQIPEIEGQSYNPEQFHVLIFEMVNVESTTLKIFGIGGSLLRPQCQVYHKEWRKDHSLVTMNEDCYTGDRSIFTCSDVASSLPQWGGHTCDSPWWRAAFWGPYLQWTFLRFAWYVPLSNLIKLWTDWIWNNSCLRKEGSEIIDKIASRTHRWLLALFFFLIWVVFPTFLFWVRQFFSGTRPEIHK